MSDVPPPPGPGALPPPPPGPSRAGSAQPAAPGPSAKGEGLLETTIGVLTSPVATLRGLAREPRAGWAVVLTIAIALLGAVETASMAGSGTPSPLGPEATPGPPEQLRWLTLVGGAIFLPLVTLGALAVWSAVLHGIARLLGGVGRYGTVFTTVGFAQAPQLFTVVGTLLAVTVGVVGQVVSWLLGVALFVWSAVLSVIAVRESHRLSTGRAIAVYLIPIGVAVALAILLFVLIVVLIVGGMSAMGTTSA